MSTIKSSDEHLTLNADGSSKDIKLQSNGSEKVIIKSDGKVGIGTGVPAHNLDISPASGDAELKISGAEGQSASIRLFADQGDDVDDIKRLLTDTSGNFKIQHYASSAYVDSMVIGSSGNVGIGVTPVSDNTLMQSVELGAGSAITGYKTSGSPNTYLTNNVKFNSSAASLYKATDQASRIVMDSSGKFYFDVASSGTADAAISWTTAMTIDNNGYVTKPAHPNFFAYSNAGNVAYGSGAEFILNIEGTSCPHFSTSTGRFTAPVSGYYHFEANIYSYSSGKEFTIKKNGSDVIINDTKGMMQSPIGNFMVSGCLSMNLAVNDYVSIGFRGNQSGNIYGQHTHFSGYLVG